SRNPARRGGGACAMSGKDGGLEIACHAKHPKVIRNMGIDGRDGASIPMRGEKNLEPGPTVRRAGGWRPAAAVPPATKKQGSLGIKAVSGPSILCSSTSAPTMQLGRTRIFFLSWIACGAVLLGSFAPVF